MKLRRAMIILLMTLVPTATSLTVGAQQAASQLTRGVVNSNNEEANTNPSVQLPKKATVRRKSPKTRPLIPAVTVLHNPEYLSGEASINVAANSNPLIRIGIAQNGVTLIEFPAADNFFAVHAGNSDLVTVEKSPSLKRDHHLVLRAGSGFVVPPPHAKGSQAIVPATSIIAQMDTGMAITLMVYPVPLLKQQAHRLVIKYNRDEVITARRTAGLATNLAGPEPDLQSETAGASQLPPTADSAGGASDVAAQNSVPTKRTKPDFKEPVETALKEATDNPKWFKRWSDTRHGLRISTMPPRDLSDSARLVIFAVRNTGPEPLRLISGYPDLYVETLNENRRPVEAGTKVEKFYIASSASDNLLAAGTTRYFALAFEAPILGAQQRLKIVVAHMSAADEPAMADLTNAGQMKE